MTFGSVPPCSLCLVLLPNRFQHAAQASLKDIEQAAAEATDGEDDESSAVVTCTICLSAYEDEEVVSQKRCSAGCCLFSRYLYYY